jgi:nitrite reductase (NADH) large subunit
MCGAEWDMFEPYIQTSKPVQEPILSTTIRKTVILGAGIAGVTAAEALRKADPSGEIVLINSEPDSPYHRMNLTRYLAGEITGDDLDLHPTQWYVDQMIDLRCGVQVDAIDLERKAVLTGGERISFDTLILAGGAKPFVPPIPGTQQKNVTVLRTRQDANTILRICAAISENGDTPRVICIGGGILGLETAGALACRSAHVTVLENMTWLLPRQLNPAAARVFQGHIKRLGIDVITSARTQEIISTDQNAAGVILEGAAAPLPADLVVISAGVRSNIQLARDAGILVNNGVVVDECMQTSHPDVFAAGDIAEYQGRLYGLWAPAMAQGTVAGSNAANQPTTFRAVPPATILKVLGIDLFSIGAVNDPDAMLVDQESDRTYIGFLFKNGRMTAAILLGDARLASRVKKAIEEQYRFDDLLAETGSVADIVQALNQSQLTS